MSLTPTIYCLDSNVVRPLYLLLEKKYPKSFIGFEDFVDKNLSNDMEQNELYVHKNAGILKLLKKRHFFSENSLVLLHWLKVIKPLKHLWIVLRSTLYILFKTIQMCSRLQYTHMRFLWKKVGAPQQSSTLCIPKKAKERTASKPSWLNQNVQCVQHEKEKETCLSINGIPCPHICSLLRFYLRFRCSFGCIQMLQHTNTQISNERTNLLYVRSWQHIILKMRRVTNQSGNLNGFCRQNLISAQLLWFDVHDALSSV